MAQRAEQAPQRSKTAIARIARAPFKLLGWICFSLFISLVLEWIFLTLVWYEQGAGHSRHVLTKEWEYISNHFTQSILGLGSPSETATWLADKLYFWLFTWTGLDSALLWTGQAGQIAGEYVGASLNVAQIFLLRLAITITSLPLFILFAYWGFFEGLVRRDLRRYGADYERGMVYHYSKYAVSAVFILPIIIYLTIPVTLNPAFVFLPFALVLAYLVMVVSATFTKYI